MAHKLTGKLIEIGKIDSGTSKKGKEWSAQDFVIKPEGKWAKEACFRFFNPGSIFSVMKLGDFIEVDFEVASRKWKDKWFTNLTTSKISKISGSKDELKFDGQKKSEEPTTTADTDDDLPF